MLRSHIFSIRLAWVLTLAGVSPAIAADADYPAKPVKVLIPFAVGGSLDTIARPLGDAFQRTVGQPMVIENLGGAGGSIAAAQVARSKPDGYQLFMGSNGPITIAPLIYSSLPYDSQALVPIVHIADSSQVLYASSGSGFNNLNDVLTRARPGAGAISFAHAGVGSLGHLSVELLASAAKVKFTGIPYKGSGAALADLGSGQVPLLFTNFSTAQPMVAAGRIRPIAVASEQRLKLLPDVPTFAELGYPAVVAKLWVGLMAPKGTPQPVIDRLGREVSEIMRDPAMRARLEGQGWEMQGGGEAQFRSFIDQDAKRWRDLSKTVDISNKN